MKIIYQGNHRTKRGEGTTTKKDEVALSERVQRDVNLYVGTSQMKRRIKRAIDCKSATSEEAKTASSPWHDVRISKIQRPV